MDIETLVDEILARTLHADPVADDPGIDERITRADVWSLIETYTDELVNDRITTLEAELAAWGKK